MPINLEEDKYFIQAGGLQKWLNTPEQDRAILRKQLIDSPEKIHPSAVEYAKGNVSTSEMVLKAAQRGFSGFGKGVNDLLGDKQASKFWKESYDEANREVYKTALADDTLSSQAGKLGKDILLGGAEMIADPAQLALGGVAGMGAKALLAGGARAVGLAEAGTTGAGRFVRGATFGAAEGSAGNVAADAVFNQYGVGEQRDLTMSALTGVGVGGILGGVAARLSKTALDSTMDRRTLETMSNRERTELIAKEDLARANQFDPNQFNGKPIEDGFNPDAQMKFADDSFDPNAGQYKTPEEAYTSEFAQKRDGFNPDEPSLKMDSIRQDMLNSERMAERANMDELARAQNEARLAEEMSPDRTVAKPRPLRDGDAEGMQAYRESIKTKPTMAQSVEDVAKQKFDEISAVANDIRDFETRMKETNPSYTDKDMKSMVEERFTSSGVSPETLSQALKLKQSIEKAGDSGTFKTLNEPIVKNKTAVRADENSIRLQSLQKIPEFNDFIKERENVLASDVKSKQNLLSPRAVIDNGGVDKRIFPAQYEKNYGYDFSTTKKDVETLNRYMATGKQSAGLDKALTNIENDLSIRAQMNGQGFDNYRQSMIESLDEKIKADIAFGDKPSMDDVRSLIELKNSNPSTINGQLKISEATKRYANDSRVRTTPDVKSSMRIDPQAREIAKPSSFPSMVQASGNSIDDIISTVNKATNEKLIKDC